MNKVIIGLGNGMPPIPRQIIFSANDDPLPIEPPAMFNDDSNKLRFLSHKKI